MIPLTHEKIEGIRLLAEQEIQTLYGNDVKVFIQHYKSGDYIKYAILGNLTLEQINNCRNIITRSGTIIGKVFFDE